MLSQAAFMAMTAAIPALAFTAYDRDAELAGLLLGAWGGGAMLGGVIAFRSVASHDPLRLGTAAWILQALPLWVLVGSPAPLWAVVALGLSGLGKGNPGSADRRVATELIPSTLRAETLTVSSALVLGAGFVGLLLTAPAIDALGATAVFGALAALQSVAAGLIWWLSRQRPARPARVAA